MTGALAGRGASRMGRGLLGRGFLAATILVSAACGGVGTGGVDEPSGEVDGASSDAPESTQARRYELRGEVVEVQPERRTVIVEHAPLEGFMDAMTMPFNVRQEWVLDAAEPGSRIRATLVVDGDRSWLEDVILRKSAARGAAAAAVVPQPQPGDPVPVISLLDQDGVELSLQQYEGEFWAFTFVYTRCPLPDFCPWISKNFAALYGAIEAEPQRYGDAQLLSITVDPAYDSPPVLREYGLEQLGARGEAGFERWRFARADPQPLGHLSHFTGLRFMPEKGEVVHSLRTVLVDPDRRVVRIFVGNTWDPAELLEALEEAVRERNAAS